MTATRVGVGASSLIVFPPVSVAAAAARRLPSAVARAGAGAWGPQELHRHPRRAKAKASVELRRPVLCGRRDPKVLDVARRLDRGAGQCRTAAGAAILRVDVH